MPAALWRAGLLLSLVAACACRGEAPPRGSADRAPRAASTPPLPGQPDCVLGVVGRPVALPCFYPDILAHANVTVEWRRGEEVLLRSERGEGEGARAGGWSTDCAAISADAARTGNLSLVLPKVHPREDNTSYSLFMASGANRSALLCTVCLRAAASFSTPLLHRQEAERGEGTTFLCQSGGGFPAPAVHWLIDDTAEPPEGSVWTLATSLPDSRLYNITSRLTVNISRDSSVSCSVENASLNTTVTSTSYGVRVGPVHSRASEAMWIFSTALCVVVGIMVIVGVGYQIHLDRISKRKKKEFHRQLSTGHSSQHPCEEEEEEAQALKLAAIETDV
ncbi:hypothetical protein SMAX5B_007963 [Scophthalmus maximus]|uniref:Ig-like domain-containing protein n=1 Tax=Scophthalmus maximus TaxID=52904 RepID=A0A2U9C475_SCOMX|nr:ICOS ligand [Scophthalmus maximus]AWP11395.1 hypothetical protein SMAX5B_007963 [Scophthalmus maximus]